MTFRLPLTNRAVTALAIALVAMVASLGVAISKAREIGRLEVEVARASAQLRTPAASAVVSIGETERELWRELEARVRTRFVPPADQLRALDEVSEVASDSGMTLTGVAIQNPQLLKTLATPGNLSVNPGTIRLTARHDYEALVDFLDRVRTGKTYVVVESLDVQRVDDHLESEIRLISLRWER